MHLRLLSLTDRQTRGGRYCYVRLQASSHHQLGANVPNTPCDCQEQVFERLADKQALVTNQTGPPLLPGCVLQKYGNAEPSVGDMRWWAHSLNHIWLPLSNG